MCMPVARGWLVPRRVMTKSMTSVGTSLGKVGVMVLDSTWKCLHSSFMKADLGESLKSPMTNTFLWRYFFSTFRRVGMEFMRSSSVSERWVQHTTYGPKSATRSMRFSSLPGKGMRVTALGAVLLSSAMPYLPPWKGIAPA